MSVQGTIKWLIFRFWFRRLSVCVLLILLPGITVASSLQAGLLLSTFDVGGLDKIADKGMAYWFVTLAVISITSWTCMGKWFLTQLDQQRTSNQQLTTQLIDYMKVDHTAMVTTITKLGTIQEQTTHVLEMVLAKLNNK